MKKIAEISFALLAACLIAIPTPAAAQDPCCDCFPTIASHADSVFCEAKIVKDLIRDNFRGTSCYVKLRVTAIKIKGTSARVRRRANTIRIAQWDREFDRIDSLLYDLGAMIDDTYDRSDAGLERYLPDCTEQLSASIENMYAHNQAMRDACHGYTEPIPGILDAPYLNAPLNEPALAEPIPAPAPADAAPPRPVETPQPGSVLDGDSNPAPAPVPKTSFAPRKTNRARVPFPRTVQSTRPTKIQPPTDIARSSVTRADRNRKPINGDEPPTDSKPASTKLRSILNDTKIKLSSAGPAIEPPSTSDSRGRK